MSFGVVAYDERRLGRGHRREGRRRRHALPEPPSSDAVVGLYCYPPDVFEIIDALEPSGRGELEITDVNRDYAAARRAAASQRVEGWWHDGGKHWADLAEVGRLIEETGRQQVIDGIASASRCARYDDDRGWFSELARASALPKPIRQANLACSKQGVIRGLHFHERGQDDLFLCLQGMVRVVVLDRESGETFTEDIGDENPVAVCSACPKLPLRARSPGCRALEDLFVPSWARFPGSWLRCLHLASPKHWPLV